MYNEQQKTILLETARQSIAHGLESRQPLPINLEDYDQALTQAGACFVTLQINGNLRGCIGSLEARQPLIQDLAENAYSAAFRDPRFPPLEEYEFEQIHIHISILNPPEPMEVSSEEDLLNQLRPGIDGLVLQDSFHRATFLPSVWESLPKPTEFLMHLKQKAGLNPQYWSETISFERYTVEDIE